MTLYDRVAATPDGSRALAAARLRREVLRCLHRAQAASGLTVADIATAIGGRRRDVRRDFDGDGNLRPDVVARYLHAMGYEVELQLVAAGEPRAKVVAGQSSLEQLADTSGFVDVSALAREALQRAEKAAAEERMRQLLYGDGGDPS